MNAEFAEGHKNRTGFSQKSIYLAYPIAFAGTLGESIGDSIDTVWSSPRYLMGQRPCVKDAPQFTACPVQGSVGVQSKLLHVRSSLKETTSAGE